jgi:hypothetical protein
VVVGKSVAWNALKIIKINHRPYLYTLRKYGMIRHYFQTCFAFQLHCSNECLEASDLFLNYELDKDSFEDPNLLLQTPRYFDMWRTPLWCYKTWIHMYIFSILFSFSWTYLNTSGGLFHQYGFILNRLKVYFFMRISKAVWRVYFSNMGLFSLI